MTFANWHMIISLFVIVVVIGVDDIFYIKITCFFLLSNATSIACIISTASSSFPQSYLFLYSSWVKLLHKFSQNDLAFQLYIHIYNAYYVCILFLLANLICTFLFVITSFPVSFFKCSLCINISPGFPFLDSLFLLIYFQDECHSSLFKAY